MAVIDIYEQRLEEMVRCLGMIKVAGGLWGELLAEADLYKLARQLIELGFTLESWNKK